MLNKFRRAKRASPIVTLLIVAVMMLLFTSSANSSSTNIDIEIVFADCTKGPVPTSEMKTWKVLRLEVDPDGRSAWHVGIFSREKKLFAELIIMPLPKGSKVFVVAYAYTIDGILYSFSYDHHRDCYVRDKLIT